jgi:hypothetical protein
MQPSCSVLDNPNERRVQCRVSASAPGHAGVSHLYHTSSAQAETEDLTALMDRLPPSESHFGHDVRLDECLPWFSKVDSQSTTVDLTPVRDWDIPARTQISQKRISPKKQQKSWRFHRRPTPIFDAWTLAVLLMLGLGSGMLVVLLRC